MSKIKMNDVKQYLAAGGKALATLALEIYGDSINQVGEEAFEDGIEIGISNTIAALYDTDVDDYEIIRVLNKFWGISKDQAEERLLYEKRQAVCRELENYLKMQGFSSKDIIRFMRSNKVYIKTKQNNELWKLRQNPEKLMKEVQKDK